VVGLLVCRNHHLLRFRKEKEAEAEGSCGRWEGIVDQDHNDMTNGKRFTH